VYFVFKPDYFVKTDIFFVYSEKDFFPLVTIMGAIWWRTWGTCPPHFFSWGDI